MIGASTHAQTGESGGGVSVPRAVAQYDDVAPAYEERIVPQFRRIAERLLAVAEIRPGDQVVEIGAGTGGLSRHVAARIGPRGSLILTDASAGMLAVAERVLASARESSPQLPSVRTIVSDLASLPLPSGEADLVVAQMTPLLESEAGLAEAFRVLRPGGRLAVAAWGTRYEETTLLNEARASVGIGPYPAVDPVAIRRRLRRAGFVGIRQRTRPMTAVHASVAAYLDYRRAFGVVGFPPDQLETYFSTLERAVVAAHPGSGPVRIGWSIMTVAAQTPDACNRPATGPSEDAGDALAEGTNPGDLR